METNCHENSPGFWKDRRDESWGAPAQFQVMPPLPSPGGELAAERPLAELQDDPWVSVSSLKTGVDTRKSKT